MDRDTSLADGCSFPMVLWPGNHVEAHTSWTSLTLAWLDGLGITESALRTYISISHAHAHEVREIWVREALPINPRQFDSY